MDCPRCGATTDSRPECPGCGVILAKARAPRPRRESLSSPPGPAWRSLVLPGVGLVLLVAAAFVSLRGAPGPAEAPRSAPRAGEAAPPRSGPVRGPTTGPAPAPTIRLEAPPVPEASLGGDPAAERDRETAARLADALRSRRSLSAADVRAAEELYSRYPDAARELLEAVLLSAAADRRQARRYDDAATLAERAVAVAPSSPRGRRALLGLRNDAGDWAAAEAVARELTALAPADAEAARALAYALVRQDRSREAFELLGAFLERHPDPDTSAFLERLRRELGAEASLDEARLAHFHVRYDGEAHEDVGREILRVLDRHYVTLVRAFDHQPRAPIPVILLSRESYFDATGAPAWSGGQYDAFDGRVRIPIGGLTASLAAGIDDTLAHELTHAFVADLSRGLAPRDLHEGLAQFMEGKRAAGSLGEDGLRALADGRLQGVGGFYAASLAFVEDLAAQRGQGGINDLLRAMAETGDVDEAFRRVYGRDRAALRQDFAARFRQRHGS